MTKFNFMDFPLVNGDETLKNMKKTKKSEKLKKREIHSLRIEKNLRKFKKYKYLNLQKFLFWAENPISDAKSVKLKPLYH